MITIEELENLPTIAGSPFRNTYGGITLVGDDISGAYIQMGDCTGSEYYGPLNAEQIEAFTLLSKVESTDVDYSLGY